MVEVEFRKLAAGARARVYWSFLWRGLVATAASAFVGKLMGMGAAVFVLAIGRAAALPPPTIRLMAQLSGLTISVVVSLVCFYIYIRWLLESRLGRHRLVLVATDPPVAEPAPPPA